MRIGTTPFQSVERRFEPAHERAKFGQIQGHKRSYWRSPPRSRSPIVKLEERPFNAHGTTSPSSCMPHFDVDDESRVRRHQLHISHTGPPVQR